MGRDPIAEAVRMVSACTPAAKVERVEAAMLQLPQVECPVVHRFGPGIYIREVTIPAGSIAIGHRQKQEHMNVFLRGRVRMLNDDGSTTELAAPMMFVGKPGRKIGYVLEDVVWLNIYSTNETDVETLEGMYLDKSAAWQSHSAEQAEAIRMLSGPCDDAADYLAVLEEFGFDESTARAQSENPTDMTALPLGGYKIKVGRSRIEGQGLFATAPIAAGEVIAPARIGGLRTIAGRYTNHAKRPNAQMVMGPSGDIDLVALADIGGCRGGQDGEEITIDYRQALGLQIKPRSEK